MKKDNLDILKKQGTGFETPKGYFATIEDTVVSKIATQRFPQETGFAAPKSYFETIEVRVLEKVGTDYSRVSQQFDTPKGYFDTIEDKVFEKIRKEEEVDKPKTILLKPKFIKVFAPLAIAASFLLMIILNYNTQEQRYSLDNVALTDVESWIENDLITLESFAIAEVFNDVSFEEELNDDDLELLDYINGTDIESALLTD